MRRHLGGKPPLARTPVLTRLRLQDAKKKKEIDEAAAR